MNNFNSNNRDFFELYAKTKNDQSMKRKKLKISSKHGNLKKFLIIFFTILIIISIGFLVLFNYFFGNFKTDYNFEKSCENLGLKTMEKIDKNIVNIALFGVDKRQDDKNGRSDATLILTLDKLHNKIKLTTLMRDSRLNIKGHGLDKLCHAYSYGGPNLAVNTINQNFELDIQDYVKVDFSQMADVIDAIGGIEINVRKEEVNSINGLLNSTPGFTKCPRLKSFKGSEKYINLNGAQALQLARIRDIDSDIQRIERQQRVLYAIYSKLRGNGSMGKLIKIIPILTKKISTSLKPTDIINFIPFLEKLKSNKIEKCKIPDPEDTKNVKPGKINGTWFWSFNLEKYVKKLKDFIYEKDWPNNIKN